MKTLTKEQVVEAINAEPELPGDMPEVIYEAVKNNRDVLAELLRLTVRLTKKGIIDRFESLQEDKPTDEEELVFCPECEGNRRSKIINKQVYKGGKCGAEWIKEV